MGKIVILVGKKAQRPNRCISWLRKRREIVLVLRFTHTCEAVHLQWLKEMF